MGERTDAELNDGLSLIQSSNSASSGLKAKFRLDAEVQHEGSNFSAGEKQLRDCSTWMDIVTVTETCSCPDQGSGPQEQGVGA